MTEPPAGGGWLRRLPVLAGVPVVAASVLGWLGSAWWAFDLLAHFRAQYAAVLLVASVFCAILRERRSLIVFGILAAGNAAMIAPMYGSSVRSDAGVASLERLSLVQFNIWMRNEDPQQVVDWLLEQRPDVAALQEVAAGVLPVFAVLLTDYESLHAETNLLLVTKDPARGIEVAGMSRLPMAGRNDGIQARLLVHGSPVDILNVHQAPPLGPAFARTRAAQFRQVRDWADSREHPVVIAGDLNATPWSFRFRSLLKGTDLVNSQAGFGYHGTWPRRRPLWLSRALAIPIDHCLHSPSIVTLDRRVGPYLGSNHLPVEIVLGL